MKKIMAKTGEYTNGQGETKGNWVEVGVIMSNANGEYIMLNPSVSLAGVQAQQQSLATKQGKQGGERVMCSIFDDTNQQGQGQQSPQQQPQNQGGYQQQPPPQGQQPAAQGGFNDFDSDIPF